MPAEQETSIKDKPYILVRPIVDDLMAEATLSWGNIPDEDVLPLLEMVVKRLQGNRAERRAAKAYKEATRVDL